MPTKLLIASTADSAMRYALGETVTDPFILVDTGRARYALLNALELTRFAGDSRVRALPLARYLRRGERLGIAAARFLNEHGIKQVLMPPQSPARAVDDVRRAVGVMFGEPYPERRCKRPEELAALRRVRDATVAALESCLACLRRSTTRRGELWYSGARLTAERLRRIARATLLEHDCSAPSLIVSHGAQTASPHEEGHGVLRAGEPILLDLFPQSMTTGYWFDMTRTVCKGEAPGILVALWEAVLAAQRAALATVRAGVAVRSVHAAAEQVFTTAGFPSSPSEGFLHSIGHGLGLDIHEAPRVGPVDGRLRAGDVITIEPGLYYRTLGGVRIEDTVLVTKEGCEDLTRFPKVLSL